jgi:hypothetical protein
MKEPEPEEKPETFPEVPEAVHVNVVPVTSAVSEIPGEEDEQTEDKFVVFVIFGVGLTWMK